MTVDEAALRSFDEQCHSTVQHNTDEAEAPPDKAVPNTPLIWARPQHYHCMERVGIRRLELELEALKEKDHAQRHLSLQQWKFSPQNFLE